MVDCASSFLIETDPVDHHHEREYSEGKNAKMTNEKKRRNTCEREREREQKHWQYNIKRAPSLSCRREHQENYIVI